MKWTSTAAPVLAVAALLALGGCGSAEPTLGTGSSAGNTVPAEGSPVPLPEPIAPVVPAAPGTPAAGVPALTGTPTDLTAATQAEAGTGTPSAELVAQDVVVGSGPPATLADTVNVRYSGTLYSDGTLFDSSWSDGDTPVEFPLDGVVPGFAQGIEGMAPGGRRVMVIPPELGYGDETNGPIPGGSTLVFVVDLVGVS